MLRLVWALWLQTAVEHHHCSVGTSWPSAGRRFGKPQRARWAPRESLHPRHAPGSDMGGRPRNHRPGTSRHVIVVVRARNCRLPEPPAAATATFHPNQIIACCEASRSPGFRIIIVWL
ncbi:uncharacterized protein B0I36DRAFT_109858 [Microdochium trichocladiopsis]|uniref:Secreted protein n=1 Tax=Microdochium trichocladiopsis TaxID=1682393 RepID=A0A9P8Y9L1_9PEZI|nr:uncharacterized protein B0I36DRAFT_109858 [Microdochium trichocladiopsis]KAH7033498.1 hypothetical protein B0I36DRAFT_109858 [Microdochium trichocladiopsis]